MEERNPVAAALGAASFIAVTQILSADTTLDWQLSWAVGIFAICIPTFARIWYTRRFPKPTDAVAAEKIRVERVLDILSICVLDMVGFALIFFHFGWIQGVLFVVSSAIAFCWAFGGNRESLRTVYRALRFQISRVAETLARLVRRRKSKSGDKEP